MRKKWIGGMLCLAAVLQIAGSRAETGRPCRDSLGFTPAVAGRAYEAFQRYFYDPEAKLYYSTTRRSDLGSIWTQAIYWDMAMDMYERTGDPGYRQLIDDIYQGGYQEYDGYNWRNKEVWFIYDDIMWWVIALARAHELTGNPGYLEKSVTGFERVWEGSYDPVNGGMFWDFKHSGKNACINYPTVIAALRLYKITGDNAYLEKAKEVYAWAREHLFDASNGRVADHKIGHNKPGYEDYTYNQGTCIGAAARLYQLTGDAAYLRDARLAADYTREAMCDSRGILPAEGDWNEQGVLKTIFAQYMAWFIKTCGQDQYVPWLRQNAHTAWANRDRQRGLTYRDYSIACPSGAIQSYEASSGVALMQLVLGFTGN